MQNWSLLSKVKISLHFVGLQGHFSNIQPGISPGISPAYFRQRATLTWLDFHEMTFAFSSASLICHGLLCIVGWPSASKPVSTWEIHTVSLFYDSQKSETAHQMLIKPSVLGQVLSNHMGQEHLIAICKAQQQQCLLCCIIHCTSHLSKP